MPGAQPRDHRHAVLLARRITAIVLTVLAALTILAGTVAVWAHALVFDTEDYVALVTPLADDAQVRHNLAVFTVDKALTATDLQARIAGVLPPRAAPVAAPLTDAVRQRAVAATESLLARPEVKQLWVAANRVAHERLMKVLRGESQAVTVSKNDVQLDLGAIVAKVVTSLQERYPSLLGSRGILNVDPSMTADEVRARLSAALGRPLPQDFATVTIYRGTGAYRAQQAVKLADKLVILVVVVAAALTAAAVAVSPRRRRTLLALGLGTLAAAVAARVLSRVLEHAVEDRVAGRPGGAVADSLVTTAMGSLGGYLLWLAVAAAVVAVVAFVAGRPAWVGAIGRAVTRLFGAHADLATPLTPVARWIAAHAGVMAAGGVLVAAVIVLATGGALDVALAVLACLGAYELTLLAFAAGARAGGEGRQRGGGPSAAA